MKCLLRWLWGCGALAALGSLSSVGAAPLTSAFTFQGQIQKGGRPVSGSADFRCSLWDAASGGTRIGPILTNAAATVVNGLFALQLDFGVDALSGDARWLQVEVRYPAGGGAYMTLGPRQPLTAAPYSSHSLDTQKLRGRAVGTAAPAGGQVLKFDGSQWAPGSDNVGAAGPWQTSGSNVYYTSGNVGIGTSGPTHRLTLQSTTDDTLRLIGPGPAYGFDARLNFGDGDLVYLEEDDDDRLTIYADVRTAILGGNVGIGVTSPTHRLTVQSATDDTLRLIGPDGGALGFGARLNFGDIDYVFLEEDTDDRLTIYASGRTAILGGNVGIGTADPAAPLHVYSPVNPTTLRIQSAGTPGSGRIEFWSDPRFSASEWRPGYIQSTDNGNFTGGLAFFINGTGPGALTTAFEIMRIVNFNVGIGTANPAAKLDVNGTARVRILEILGADVAEKFPVSEEPKPGMVMAIDKAKPGSLCVSRGAYNRAVAGVVSGANGLSAGAVLGNAPGMESAPPIALSGRVWVYCDATEHAIEPGDLLTTADLPGHAMKVTDYARAQGAILGKAMTPLAGGQGLVLVLVSLQ
jgi:hypothetical protein